jgi:hypothetical protein
VKDKEELILGLKNDNKELQNDCDEYRQRILELKLKA